MRGLGFLLPRGDHYFKVHLGMANAHAAKGSQTFPKRSALIKPSNLQHGSAFYSQTNQATFTL